MRTISVKAIRYEEYGGVEYARLGEAATPVPGPGEVLVQVAAAGVNPADWKIGAGCLRGMIDFPLPFIPGMDFSGKVVGFGYGAQSSALGDEVCGATDISRLGTFAELVAVPEDLLVKKPCTIDLMSAAGFPLAALTAWHVLFGVDQADIQPGQTVMIHGGAGGTGMFAVQLAKWRGARVIATASARNSDFLRSLNADEAIDYQSTAFEKVVRDIDAVIDLVGGEVQDRSFAVLRKGGRLASIVSFPSEEEARRRGVRTSFMMGYRNREMLQKIADLIDSGSIKVTATKVVPLENAAAALAESREGHVRGKIVPAV